MEEPSCTRNLCQRSSSPVFFTGCTTGSTRSPCKEDTKLRTMSPDDFQNLKRSVDILKEKCAQNSMTPNVTLLPSPPAVVGINNCNLASYHKPKTHSSPADLTYEGQEKMPYMNSSPAGSEDFSPHARESTDPSSSHITPYSAKSIYNTPRSHADHMSQMNSRKRKRTPPDNQCKFPKRVQLNTTPKYVWEQMSQDIWQLYHDNKQTLEVYRMKMKLRDQLHHMLLDTFPNCGLYVVGSSMTGLGANSSDMDMCLMLSHSEIDQELEATGILQTVYETFIQYDFLVNVELIPAKVPILRFRDSQSAIEVDLNINNSVGIRNTQLLTSYSRIDKRVPPLVLLTKLWARCHGINDAKHHTLSSYSLVLMVIHYLQYGCKPPVLPSLQVLQPEKFQPHTDVRTLSLKEELPPFVSKNTEHLAGLFLGFLDYFANKFDFANHVMSVRIGGVLPKHISMNNTSSPKNKRGHWKHLCIEEPFNLTNTACSVFKDSPFYYMRDVFLRSWNMLRSSGNLGSILDMNKN